jgi:diguanylate cyclase (GGDEF)-like protein/putative nucleotidyltransferase with HDIG domain
MRVDKEELVIDHGRGAGRRRPMLLALVYGVFLVLVGITASALVAVASVHVSSATLAAVVSRDRSLVDLFVNDTLRVSDLAATGPGQARVAELEAKLAALTARDEILRIELRGPDGTIVASDHPGLRGQRPPASAGMQRALAGKPYANLVAAGQVSDPAGTPLVAESVVQEYLPLVGNDGQPLAVIALWRNAAPLVANIDSARRDIVLVTLTAGALLAVILFLIFRAAQARITGQHAQLLEAERRDPLTEMLNHGAVVALLAEAVEAARASDLSIGVALLDIDNFRLFNEAHGHDAADEVLLRVADLVEREAERGIEVARYGPDEFLLLQRGGGVIEMEAAVERLRAGLAELSVQFGESERLPVSASVGICAYPEHADSVTDLLSAAAVAVAEAKASGGDTVRIARVGEETATTSGSLDVLQGLVIAVDTKDRYTKRHSEDVARYAVFLAERLGVDEEVQRTIRLAGLLHDVGKIGIPDTLLRKPSKLTAEEFDIFKQHVALGDAIVRDVPNVDMVRAGIRHHHERWDGKGYLEGLDGEEIPFIGRVLAVADAFSAMTTTRPYRKALPLEEALKRLGDAAGSQLQEDLVTAFIAGIETAADAPLPGERPIGLWQPHQRVA